MSPASGTLVAKALIEGCVERKLSREPGARADLSVYESGKINRGPGPKFISEGYRFIIIISCSGSQ